MVNKKLFGAAEPADGSEEEAPDAEQVLARAWPDGVPTVERALLNSLSPLARGEVIRRLNALVPASAGQSLEDRASAAGLSRQGFYNLRSRWNPAKVSLDVLVPNAKPGGGRRAVARPELKANLKAELNARSAPSRAVAALKAAAGVSNPTLRRLARDVRMEAASSAEQLIADFGRRFALDLVVLDLPLKVKKRVEYALGGFLIEQASGLILAGILDTADVSSHVARATLEAGAQYAERERLRIPGDLQPSVQFVLGDTGEAQDVLRLYGEAAKAFGEDSVHARAPRRFGRFLLQNVGMRIGRIRIKPRARMDDPVVGHPDVVGMPISDAQALLTREVCAHNREIEERLAGKGLIRASGDASALRRLIGGANLFSPPIV